MISVVPEERNPQDEVRRELSAVRYKGLAGLGPEVLTPFLDAACKEVPGYHPGLTRTAALKLLLNYQIGLVAISQYQPWLKTLFGLKEGLDGEHPTALRKLAFAESGEVSYNNFTRPDGGREKQGLKALAEQIVADCLQKEKLSPSLAGGIWTHGESLRTSEGGGSQISAPTNSEAPIQETIEAYDAAGEKARNRDCDTPRDLDLAPPADDKSLEGYEQPKPVLEPLARPFGSSSKRPKRKYLLLGITALAASAAVAFSFVVLLPGSRDHAQKPQAAQANRQLKSANSADLNNDGTDDALFLTDDPDPATGAHPGLSTGTGFRVEPEWWHDPYTDWKNMTPLIGDVTGDGKADLLYLIPTSTGTQAWVLPSTGNGLRAPLRWWDGVGYRYSETKAALGDVNGDGIEDLVLATPQDGGGTAVSVALSIGSGLQPPTLWWSDSHTDESVMRLMVGDVTGDGVADVTYLVPTPQGTDAWVLPSTKTGLQAPQLWWNGDKYLYSGIKALLGDMNGDGADDLVLVTSQAGGGTAFSVGLSLKGGSPPRWRFWLQQPWWTDAHTDWHKMMPFVGNYTGDRNNGHPVADFGYLIPTRSGVQAWVLPSTKTGLQSPRPWWIGAGWRYSNVKVAAG